MNLSKQPKIKSLKNRNEIKDLLANGRKVFNKYGIIFIKQDSSLKNNMSAVLIKKKCGNAVKRNYIKRIVRNFIREHSEQVGKYNRTLFLYLFKGSVNYEDMESVYLNALNKYEKSSTHFY